MTLTRFFPLCRPILNWLNIFIVVPSLNAFGKNCFNDWLNSELKLFDAKLEIAWYLMYAVIVGGIVNWAIHLYIPVPEENIARECASRSPMPDAGVAATV